jgi:hypothetical protein
MPATSRFMSRVSGDRAGGEQRREVAGSAPPHAILSALAIKAYNEIELKRSLEAEAREDALRLTISPIELPRGKFA